MPISAFFWLRNNYHLAVKTQNYKKAEKNFDIDSISSSQVAYVPG